MNRKKIIMENVEDHTMLLALAATQSSDPAGSCLSPEHMAALADMRLSSDEYEAVLEHLDTCSSCYMKWLKLSLIRTEDLISAKPGVKKQVIYAFAMAASLLIFLRFTPFTNPVDPRAVSGNPELSELISKSYESALVQRTLFNNNALNKYFSLPWEKNGQSYGFGDSAQYSPSFRAFGAGLWTAREMLSEEKDTWPMPEFLSAKWQSKGIKAKTWPETSWAVCYWMGQWSFLVQSVCLSDSDIRPAFWDDQGRILAQLMKNYAELAEKNEENARVVSNALYRARDAVNKKQRRKLAFELGILIEYFPEG